MVIMPPDFLANILGYFVTKLYLSGKLSTSYESNLVSQKKIISYSLIKSRNSRIKSFDFRDM
jgi:hypothetical protein